MPSKIIYSTGTDLRFFNIVHNLRMTTKKLQIGEAAEITGVPPKTLRYYEDIGLVHPGRTDSGYRQYDDEAIERVRFILKAKLLGFTLDEIADVLRLRDEETEPCDHVSALIDTRLSDIEARITKLAELKIELEYVRDSNKGAPAGPCRGTVCHLIEEAPVGFR